MGTQQSLESAQQQKESLIQEETSKMRSELDAHKDSIRILVEEKTNVEGHMQTIQQELWAKNGERSIRFFSFNQIDFLFNCRRG